MQKKKLDLKVNEIKPVEDTGQVQGAVGENWNGVGVRPRPSRIPADLYLSVQLPALNYYFTP